MTGKIFSSIALMGLLVLAAADARAGVIGLFLGAELGSVRASVEESIGSRSNESQDVGASFGGEFGVRLPILGFRGGMLYRRIDAETELNGHRYGLGADDIGAFVELAPLALPIPLGFGASLSNLEVDDKWEPEPGKPEDLKGDGSSFRAYVWGGVPLGRFQFLGRLGYNWADVDLETTTKLEDGTGKPLKMRAIYDGPYAALLVRFSIIK